MAIAMAPALFVVLWSSGYIGARLGLPYIEPITFLALRMVVVVIIFTGIAAFSRVRWLTLAEFGHSMVTGLLLHAIYLGSVFVAISQGVPTGISALIPGLQPILMSTIANRWMGETVTRMQWIGLGLGLFGVLVVLHDRSIVGSASVLGWGASFTSLIAITIATLYQKRFCGAIDWRVGNLVQYGSASILLCIVAMTFETQTIHWNGKLIFAIAWLAIVLSIAAVGLMYWLLRRSAATGFASLFYMVPAVTAVVAYALFGERLDAVSLAGMVVCAAGVVLVNRTTRGRRAPVESVEGA
jgi:drug/metabolite transporter (DMT)-like permease